MDASNKVENVEGTQEPHEVTQVDKGKGEPEDPTPEHGLQGKGSNPRTPWLRLGELGRGKPKNPVPYIFLYGKGNTREPQRHVSPGQ
jgi:hypothetical protein